MNLIASERVLRELSSLLELQQISHVTNNRGVQLDLVFSSTPMYHSVSLSTDPLLPYENIHPPISITLECPSAMLKNAVVYIPDLKRCNLEGVENELTHGNLQLDLEDDLSGLENFIHTLGKTIEKHSPLKRIGPSCFPRWFNNHLKQLVILKKTVHRRYKETLSDHDYYSFSCVREQCKRVTRACRIGYVEHLEAVIPSNMKVLWSFVNGLKHDNPKPGVMELDNLEESEPDRICELFSTYFRSVYTLRTVPIHLILRLI